MLYTRPKSLLSQNHVVSDVDGREVAELAVSFWKEGGQLHHDGAVYRVEREGLMSGNWQLLDKGEVIYEATKPSMIKNRFMVVVKNADLELSPTSWTLRSFQVVGPDWAELGTIRRRGWFTRKATIDLDKRVPVLAQLFLFFLANVIWKRAQNSGAGGGG